jgi:hypothetical protein
MFPNVMKQARGSEHAMPTEKATKTNPTTYGYARVSTREQNLDRQLDALRAFGLKDARIYQDKARGVRFGRPPKRKPRNWRRTCVLPGRPHHVQGVRAETGRVHGGLRQADGRGWAGFDGFVLVSVFGVPTGML